MVKEDDQLVIYLGQIFTILEISTKPYQIIQWKICSLAAEEVWTPGLQQDL